VTGYLWLKAFHIVFVVAWMAGMLYLPRLFVYHAGVAAASETSKVFKVMERRLLRFIMTPALLAVWATGLGLAWWSGSYMTGWLHAKIALVLVLSGLHGYFSGSVKRFAADANLKEPKFFRVINEIPTILLILIVFLVVLKPF
jgi:protoporphyrinogen IX oxidase